MKIDFDFQPAFTCKCPVCGDKYVGPHPQQCKEGEDWVKNHGAWHSTGAKTPPPKAIVIP